MAKYSLVTSLLLDSGDYERGIKKISKETQAFTQGVEKLGNGAKMLGGLAAGFLAVGSSVEIAKKFINATSDGADAFEKKITEAEFATNAFFNTIAKGDFSNLLDNLQKAVEAGGEYADIMDDIENRRRSLSVAEAEARNEIDKLKNEYAKISPDNKDERVKKLDEIIAKEKELNKIKKSIAKEQLDAEVKEMQVGNNMSSSEIFDYWKDFNNNDEIRAKAQEYLKVIDEINKAKNKQDSREIGGGNLSALEKQKAEIETLYPNAVKFSTVLKQMNNDVNGADKTIDKFIQAWVEYINVIGDVDRATTASEKKRANALNGLNDEGIKNEKEQLKAVNDEMQRQIDLATILYEAKDELYNDTQDHLNSSNLDTSGENPWAQTLDYANKIENAIDVINGEPITVTVDTTSIDETGDKIKEFWKNISDSFNAIVNEGIVDLTSDLASGIANAMAGGGKINFKKILLGNIATIAEQLGKLAIGVGVAVLGIQESLESLNPYVAIAAGVALIALSAYAKNRMQKMGEKKYATGGIVGGYSYSGDNVLARVNSGEMILNQAQQSRLFAIANGGNISAAGIGGEVNFKIEGANLVGVLSNYNKRINSRR